MTVFRIYVDSMRAEDYFDYSPSLHLSTLLHNSSNYLTAADGAGPVGSFDFVLTFDSYMDDLRTLLSEQNFTKVSFPVSI